MTESEMKVFLEHLIYMGARRKSGSSGFWKKESEREVFRVMSLEGFSQITRYLHISDLRMQLVRQEWFQKLEPLNTMLRTRC